MICTRFATDLWGHGWAFGCNLVAIRWQLHERVAFGCNFVIWLQHVTTVYFGCSVDCNQPTTGWQPVINLVEKGAGCNQERKFPTYYPYLSGCWDAPRQGPTSSSPLPKPPAPQLPSTCPGSGMSMLDYPYLSGYWDALHRWPTSLSPSPEHAISLPLSTDHWPPSTTSANCKACSNLAATTFMPPWSAALTWGKSVHLNL